MAIVGAPMDELTSDAPGTRFGPRAIRSASCAAGPHLEAGVDALREVLRVVDFGDAPILPADPVRSHQAIEATVAAVLAAGAVPVVLGGDHSIAEPDIRACAAVHGPVGLIHFDAHTDTGRECFGVELSHGSPMYRLVEAGHVDPQRYVQIGLRGYWPGEDAFAWQQRARHHLALHARRARPRHPRRRGRHARDDRRRPGVRVDRRRRARPGLRARAPARPSPAG